MRNAPARPLAAPALACVNACAFRGGLNSITE